MSATNVIDHEFAAAGVCPQCGKNLLVPCECGYCGWIDEDKAKAALADAPDDMKIVGKWTKWQMLVLVLVSALLPIFGIFAAFYGVRDKRKRGQAVFLLIFSLFSGQIVWLVFQTLKVF